MLEVQRARKALQAFCARCNTLRSAGQARLVCRGEANAVEILETGGPGAQDRVAGARAVLRLSYDNGVWQVYWSRNNGAWEPYPHLAQADSMDRIIDELEQAPLHVHWG